MFQSQRLNTILSGFFQSVVLAYQTAAIIAIASALYLAVLWLRNPFIGGFFEQTMVLNNSKSTQPGETWALFAQGAKITDQLLSVANTDIHSAEDLQQVLMHFKPSETVPVVLVNTEGEKKTYDIKLTKFSSIDRTAYFVIPYTLSIAFLLVSIWIFGLRRSEPAGRAFTMLTSSLAIVTGALFDLYTTHHLSRLWVAAAALSGGAFLDLALAFPQEPRFTYGRPYLRWIGYVIAIFLILKAYAVMYDFSLPPTYYQAWRDIYIFTGVCALIYLGFLAIYSVGSPSPVVRTQARLILIGAVIAFGWIVSWIVRSTLYTNVSFNPYMFLPIIVFPLVTGYVILRFRLLQTDYWVRQSALYTLLTVLIVTAYGLIVSGLGLIFSDAAMPANNPYLIGGLVFLLAVLLEPLRTRMQALVDATFFRGQRAYQERLRSFAHDLTGAHDLASIGSVLRQQIVSSLAPDRVHIYIYDPVNDQYVTLPGEDGRLTSDIRFSSNSPLVLHLQNDHLPLYLDAFNLPPNLKSEESRLALVGARLFVALPGKEKIVGWLALGAPLSGHAYTPQDLTFLENICDQAAVAIGRVQTVANLERRVQEMNALTRVSQGVNVTLTFDDVLELIYTQTSLIIPASHFHITLYNKAADFFYYGFCVDDNERLVPRENIPLPPSLGLGPEIIRKGRPILTQDYTRECQALNLTPASQGIYAWMGVPLNAGIETMGSLSVGSRDATVTYTRAQLDLLQAIADVTVGAIVKARLLEETQKRAHQLSTLNEITRQLTSTLEPEPLLRNILESAVGILKCEAGTLFEMDEQTGDLFFRVTVGPPVSQNLIGQRLPAGTGIAGRAVLTRSPVIENDAQHSLARFAATDRQTGFVSRSMLAVPLEVKDRVLGVVEVINRRDGLPFTEDDQTLLTAFAGQAAVAVENARLYTLTDQELVASMEELSVMQRISRELNATLDIDRAMRITLEWAMRQSNAEAGLIGVLEGDTLRIMAQQGYESVLVGPAALRLTLELPSIRRAIDTAQSQQVSLLSNGSKGILPSAHTQIVIPIQREANVIGLLLLESLGDSQEDLAFLNRLSGIAAIAISNAQLYDEIQRANQAKSEFVSFVAHELKNPMTSIKGYTELLAAGSVGQVTPMQSNFLSTIRSNVERMSTLVSDLNDNAKIEAGSLRLDYKAVEINDIVDEVIRSTKRQIEDKKQAIDVQIPPVLPLIWADRTRVAQVLTNLVSNAHKYTPEGGTILVGAETSANKWDPEGAKQVVHLWVKDNGIGISIEDQARIFQKFFRSDDSKAREAPGTGLGLNITKSLVEIQGGRIWFESEYRHGTTFHFTVPVAEN